MRRHLAALVAATLVAVVALVGTASSSASEGHGAPAWQPMKGIAVDLSGAGTITDARAMAIGSELFSMLRTTFHANAVSLNFPFWQAGSRSNDPERASMTPSPGRLEMLTELAERYGLAVQYRPYLYEGNLTKQSRPSIEPTDVAVWFRNYWTFLQPYLATAAADGAASFSVALEFTSLLPYPSGPYRCPTCLSQWTQLVAKAKTVYPGPLLYSQQHDPQESIPLTERGYDAYQPVLLKSPRDLSVHALTVGFIQNLQMVEMQAAPRDLTLEEVGIPAVARAYLRPNWYHYPPSTPVDRPVQADWFAAACNALVALHLQGLYYWSIDFNTFTPAEDATSSIYNWLRTPSAAQIADCYARVP